MSILSDLITYQKTAQKFPGLSSGELIAKIPGDLDPRLIEGVNRGIDPLIGHGQGRIDKRFLSALTLSKNRENKVKVHNCAVSVAKHKPYPYENPYKSDTHVYTLRRIREALENVHRDDFTQSLALSPEKGLNSGRILKDELMHSMQDTILERIKSR